MTRDEQGALETVKRYFEGYAKGDVELCMSTIAPSGPLLLLGTNADEILTDAAAVRAGLSRDFAAMQGIRIGAFRQQHVEASATQAFVLLEAPLAYRSGGEETATVMRFALSLGRIGEAWLIRSGLVSVPFGAGTYVFDEA